MKSTDHNLNNPMVVDTIPNPKDWIDHLLHPEAVAVTQETYDLIQKKDPGYIYIISDAIHPKAYYGDSLIVNDKPERMYLIGPSDKYGEYILYLNENREYHNGLIEICRFDDPQQAIISLNKFNKVGSHHNVNLQIYHLLSKYITRDIKLHDILIGIISLFGYQNDMKLQEVMQLMSYYDKGYGIKSRLELNLPAFELRMLRDNPNHLFRIYIDLYDLIVKNYNCFTDKKFQDSQEPDLSEVIENVFRIITIIFSQYNRSHPK